MDNKAEGCDAGEGQEAAFASRRAAIAARAGLRCDFIRVPKLATMLGVSAASIHSHMQRGTFPIPHRKVGKASVVKLDDYVDWFHSDLPESSAKMPAPTNPEVDSNVARGQAKARKLRFKLEVLESLRRKGHAM